MAVSVESMVWAESEPAPILMPRRNGQFAPTPTGVCRRGHALEPFNLVASDLPSRTCLACCRARAAVTYARRKGRPLPDLQILADRIFKELESQVAREMSIEDIALFRPGRAARVDWARFADGNWWEMFQGEDFESTPKVAAACARAWASRSGVRAEVMVWGDCVAFRFSPGEDNVDQGVDHGA